MIMTLLISEEGGSWKGADMAAKIIIQNTSYPSVDINNKTP
jgi:hypothetical protein